MRVLELLVKVPCKDSKFDPKELIPETVYPPGSFCR